MKVLVAVKHTYDVELKIKVKDGAVDLDGMQYVMSAWDERAVEAAIILKEDHNAETTVISIGTEDASVTLRKAFAMGIEKGILICDSALDGADSQVIAHVLQSVVKRDGYDLVITGRQAQDTDSGQTGCMLAELAGLPCVSNLIKLEFMDEGHVRAFRQGDLGKEIIEVTLPAVITVNDSINEPRLAGLKGIMMAKKKTIETLDLTGIGTSAEETGAANPSTRVTGFINPPQREAGKKFEGDPLEITQTVVNLLATEAKVL